MTCLNPVKILALRREGRRIRRMPLDMEVHIIGTHAASRRGCWSPWWFGAIAALRLGRPLPSNIGRRQLEPSLVESHVECGLVISELLHNLQIIRILQERQVRS